MKNLTQPLIIDMKTWHRKQHFDFFMGFENPVFNVTVDIEVSSTFKLHKAPGGDLTSALVHAIARAANGVPEFRQRLRTGADGSPAVVQWEFVQPSFTVLTPDELFNFCHVEFSDDPQVFNRRCREAIQKARVRGTIFDPAGTDDSVLYMSGTPFLHFRSVTHPNPSRPPDSVPRIAWGACRAQPDGRVLMPLNLQAHHALIDALHAARFFDAAQAILA